MPSVLSLIALLCLLHFSGAFMHSAASRTSRTAISMKFDDFKKVFTASVIGASLFVGSQARAEIDYEGVKYLGGGDKIDLNNANIRSYTQFKGYYPTLASKIVSNGPYKTVADVYNIPGLTSAEKDNLKKFENKFVVLDEKPEYVMDKINNGLYR